MIPAPLHPREQERLAVLQGYRVMDTPAEGSFDDLVHLASQIAGCPISLVGLIDEHRQWFKAKRGIEGSECPRNLTFCSHAILDQDNLMEVEDAQLDPRFHDHPMVVDGPRIRFYAGIPLVAPEGLPLGALCVVDHVPHRLTAEQRDALKRLGRQVVALIGMHKLVEDSRTAVDKAARSQAELAASEARFRAISEASPLGVFVCDVEGNALYVNPRWVQLTGLPLERALGRGWVDAVHPEDMPLITRGWEASVATGAPFICEYRYRTPDGGIVWVRARAAEMRDGQRLMGYVGVSEDISEHRRGQEELQRTRDEALAAMRAKGDFLATMSHEIRTPMNGVIGMTGLLLDTDLSNEQQEYVDTIRTCAESLLVLINDILDASKIEAGKLSLERTAFPLVQVVEEAAGLLAEGAQRKGLDLAVIIDPELPPLVHGDPSRLRQILVNLLGNAVKFTENGAIAMTVRVAGSRLEIAVRDSGIGMDGATVNGLFRPFTQADASTSRRFGGTGLGLAISKRLAQLMDGDIRVSSTSNVGSEFTLDLPLEPAAGGEHPVVDLRGAAIGMPPGLRQCIGPWLTAWGGRTALADELPAVEVVTASPAPSRQPGSPPAILVTTFADRLDDEEATAAGFAACIVRPLRLAAVAGALGRALDRARPATLDQDRNLPRFIGRVLVADDNPVNLKVAVAMLLRCGLRADVAANGIEALMAMERIPYDLVLMDCQMPELDGLEATREQRRREAIDRTVRVPVVALTANAMAGDRERCLEAGMDEHLPKPIRMEALVEILKRFLPPATGLPIPRPSTGRTATGFGSSGLRRAVASAALEPNIRPDLDEAILARLLEDLGDPSGAILVELEANFRIQAGSQVAALRGADPAQVAANAHSLKGQSLTLGFSALAAAALDIERAAKAGDQAAVDAGVAGVPALFARALAAFAARLPPS